MNALHGREHRRLGRGLSAPSGLLAASLLFAACSGGGAGGGEVSASQFQVLDVSVTQGQTWRINRPIQVTFSQPLDFATVSQNTVNVARVGGGPAVGEYRWDPAQPAVLVFQPTCPTEPDYSDAGLIPGGVLYELDIPSANNAASTVLSQSGAALIMGRTLQFQTPVSDFPSDLFLDTVPGPPTPLPGSEDANGVARGTRLKLVQDGEQVELPFLVNEQGIGNLGDFVVPLNLYSTLESQFEVLIEFDQPVNPAAENISSDRIQIQYLRDGQWISFSTSVELQANCTETGSTVAVKPVGVLPQGRDLRIVVTSEFEDIIGIRNVLALDRFARMHSDEFTDADGNHIATADEFLEQFVLSGTQDGSFEDPNALFVTPTAQWGDGSLQAAFAFVGTGGPGGDFDYHVQVNSDVVFDTTSQLVLGGPGGVPTTSQVAVNGVLNVRDLYIPPSSTLRLQGPNPAIFLCSGNVRIEGTLAINGNRAQPIFTLNTPFQPEPGASGNGGGGDGGTGSPLTTQSTPRGGTGSGAFNVPNAGGQGGESGWFNSSVNDEENSRAGGGGGGALGHDVILPADGCFDQSLIGLDLEDGFPGATQANAAVRGGGEKMPWGGRKAMLPFLNETPVDDFWGVMRKSFGTPEEVLVQGELINPTPASGGGAGGDSTISPSNTYPPMPMVNNNENKGAGGGGGAGALSILALGDISIGPSGRIQATGGHGSGGENTWFVNRVGGGSGGGGGGHIILQSASQIDLSEVPTNAVAVSARGGQGGAGADNFGGADDGETTIAADARHIGVSGPGDTADNPWINMGPPNCSGSTNVVRAAGGDGGPGLIQFHVGALPDDVLYPGAGESVLGSIVKPPPVGYDLEEARWVDQLMPQFGRFSTGQSKWIPLGAGNLAPDTNELLPISFLFDGTDTAPGPEAGRVLSEDEVVADLPPLLAPASPLEQPGLPEISADDPRTMVLDASPLTGPDAVYTLNPNLLRRFRLRVADQDFSVQAASYDDAAATFALTVASDGPALPSAGLVELVPRYFAITTDGTPDLLLDSSAIYVTFQATKADQTGAPDLSQTVPAPDEWTADVETLNQAMGNPEFKFFRFRVLFDIAADGGGLTFSSPRPRLEFLRVPFRF